MTAAALLGHVTPAARPLVFARLLRVLAAFLLLGTLLPAGHGPVLVGAAPPDDLSNFQGFWPCNTGVRIARAGSEADVQRAVAGATAVQAVGLGHSWWKEPFCAAEDGTGVNIPMTSITDKAVRIDADAMAVEVDAGVRTRDLLDALAAQGFTLPTFPWFIDQTIGGGAAGRGRTHALPYSLFSATSST